MNRSERQSYFSFVGLYLVSTFILITLGAYWYYNGQLKTMDNLLYYQLLHVADDVSSKVINAHMHGSTFEMPVYDDYEVTLLDADGKPLYGNFADTGFPLKPGQYESETLHLLVTTGTNDHLGVRYVAVATDDFIHRNKMLRHNVFKYTVAALIFVTIVGSLLSHLFLQPLRAKVALIERFIRDITHELNTPITALQMSTKRAVQKGEYDERTLRNISASSKQLYDIYSALAYINFNRPKSVPAALDIAESVRKSIDYFDELAASKSIRFTVQTEATPMAIAPQQATMLVNNLLSNAVKYSPVGSSVTVLLKNRVLMVQDEGIGIAPEKLPAVFERFNRATDYAGGFGLGLSIVKTICDEYGIVVRITSEPEHGTTVMLIFPG